MLDVSIRRRLATAHKMAATINGTPDFVYDYTYNSSDELVSVRQHGLQAVTPWRM